MAIFLKKKSKTVLAEPKIFQNVDFNTVFLPLGNLSKKKKKNTDVIYRSDLYML